jgi:hypothetical protein
MGFFLCSLILVSNRHWNIVVHEVSGTILRCNNLLEGCRDLRKDTIHGYTYYSQEIHSKQQSERHIELWMYSYMPSFPGEVVRQCLPLQQQNLGAFMEPAHEPLCSLVFTVLSDVCHSGVIACLRG